MGSNNANPNSQSKDKKPLIIIHRRVANFNPLLKNRLAQTYTLLEPFLTAGTDQVAVGEFLRSHGSEARAMFCMGPPTPVGKDILDCLPWLKCVVVSSVGTDHIDLPECRRRGISVANSGDCYSDDLADYAVVLFIDVVRKISASDRFIRVGSCPQPGDFPLGSRLGGKRVGIVGLGNIGSRVAKRLLSCKCNIAYNSRKKKPSVPYPYYDNVYNLALDSDVLILCCPLTDQTHHLIDKDILSALGKDGIIINVGRGGLVDERVMVQFLVEGKLGGAGLDVFENEPNVPKELFGLGNVVLSHHNAVLTPESLQASDDIVVANLEAFFSNKPLLTPIRWE